MSLIAIGFGFIIGGAITTETVFSYPGLGLATYQAIGNNDLPMMQALFMFSSVAVILFNICADMVLDRSRPTDSGWCMSSPTWRRRKQSAQPGVAPAA